MMATPILDKRWASMLVPAALVSGMAIGCGARKTLNPQFTAGRQALMRGRYEPSIQQLQDYLRENHAGFEVMTHSEVFTMQEVAAAIEQYHDEGGIMWPMTIAPYQVLILPLNVAHRETMAMAEKIYGRLTEAGLEVLLDDRDERAGFKFKDADLIGIPLRLTVGEKSLQQGQVELKLRRGDEVLKVDVDKAVSRAKEMISAEQIGGDHASAAPNRLQHQNELGSRVEVVEGREEDQDGVEVRVGVVARGNEVAA